MNKSMKCSIKYLKILNWMLKNNNNKIQMKLNNKMMKMLKIIKMHLILKTNLMMIQ